MNARVAYVATTLLAGGLALAVLGVALIYPPAAVIVCGAGLAGLGIAILRGSRT